jgi:prepilin-type N-terminal cleavage/methylation domain-containing protein
MVNFLKKYESKTYHRKDGFSFLEVLIGIVILSVGLIPLMWAVSGGTSQVGVTLRQVQAANHSANLLEALRATPFQDLSMFPPSMIQLTGGDNKWRKPSEATDVTFPYEDEVNKPAPPGATNVFDKFVNSFFPKNDTDVSIVPPLERQFRRYFIILKDDETTPRYITLIVRVEWMKTDTLTQTDKKGFLRSTELRTVISDPYFSDT